MKVTKYLVQQNTHQQETGGLVISLRKLQLGSINKLHTLVDPNAVSAIELDGNFLKELDIDILKEFQSLSVLTASLNFVQKISKLVTLKQLQELDVSTNRIKLIADLSPMQALEYLDVSHNQIAYIERLPESLKVLKAGHNQLDDMGYVPPSLQVLDLKNNQIYRLTDIGKASSHLHILDLENNFINKEQFSDLLVYLEKYATSLKELVLAGNDIATVKDYQINIIGKRPLQKLDHMIITPYILKAFTEIHKQRDISKVIEQTRAEYLRRIKQQVDAKQKILASLKAKQDAVEDLFRQFRDSNAQRLISFEEYCNKGLLKDGKDLEYQREIVMEFDQRLKNVVQANTFEERTRRRRELEDQSELRSRLQPKKELYGKPGYNLLPQIEEAKVSREGRSSAPSSQQMVSEQYIRRRPNIPSRPYVPGEYPAASASSIKVSNPQIPDSEGVIYQEPASGSIPYKSKESVSNPKVSEGYSKPSVSNPQSSNNKSLQGISNPQGSKESLKPSIQNIAGTDRSKNSKPSNQPSSGPRSAQVEPESGSKVSARPMPSNTSILNTIKQKRQSLKQKSTKISSNRSPQQNNTQQGIFDPKCYAYFKKYFSKP